MKSGGTHMLLFSHTTGIQRMPEFCQKIKAVKTAREDGVPKQEGVQHAGKYELVYICNVRLSFPSDTK